MSQGKMYTQPPAERVRRVLDPTRVSLQVYLPAKLRRELKCAATDLGLTTSELTRQLLVIGLEQFRGKPLSLQLLR